MTCLNCGSGDSLHFCPFCGEWIPHEFHVDLPFTRNVDKNELRAWIRNHLEKCSGLVPLPTLIGDES